MAKKTKKLPITLCVITHDSGDRIKDMILKHKDVVSEVLVVVQESTDDTLARAREVADVAIERRCKGTADPDANWIFSLASNPWILYLGDDEYLSGTLKKKLKVLIKENVDSYWFKRTNYVDGIDIFDILHNDMQPRLFKKGALDFSDKIHMHPQPKEGVKAAFVEYDIIHERTLEQLISSNRDRDKIASKEAIQMQENFIRNVENLLKDKKQLQEN